MCPLPEIGTGAHPHCSVTTKTGDGRFVGIEHVALVGGESGQVGIGRAIVAKARAAGFAGKIQRLHVHPPDGGLRLGLDQCQPLSLWLEKAQVAVAFERAAVHGQQFQIEGLGLPEGGHLAHAHASLGQRHAHRLSAGLCGMTARPDLRHAALLVSPDADELIPIGPTQTAYELVHCTDFQGGGATQSYRVGQVLALAD